MHDGQNIFDNATSYSGEWEVDESLNRLSKEQNFDLIVVGIDNGKQKRMVEYNPWKNEMLGGGEGQAYVEFIVETLKPHIDSLYRTKSDRGNTGLMGSSMGGLISHFGAMKYPDVFGKAGVFSPAYWTAPQIFDFTTQKGRLENTKMYFIMGDKEGENMVSDMEKVIQNMNSSGFAKENIVSKIIEGGRHHEKLWREEFAEAILWLYQ